MNDEQIASYWRLQHENKVKAGKGAMENSIEAGPAHTALPAVERDTQLLRDVAGTAGIVMSPAGGLTRDEASNMATDDILAIRDMKDQELRNT